MKVLTCYLIRGLMKPFFLSFILINGLLLIGQVVSSLDRFLESQTSLFLIARSLLLQIPENTFIATPISILLAVLSFSGRMSANNELTAISSSGISFMPIIAIVSAISLLLSLSLLYLNETLLPVAYKEYKQLMGGSQQNNKLYLKIGEHFISIGNLNGNSLSSIRIQTTGKELYAEKGEYHQGWLLSNGIERRIENGEVVEEKRFNKRRVFLPDPKALSLILKCEKIEELSLTELFRAMRLTESYGLANRKAKTEFHFRTSFSFSPFILALLGLGIITRGFKVGLYASFGLALVLSFFYWEMNLFLRSLSLVCSPMLSGWGANLMALAIAVKLVWR
ncbi:MAG: LptF/LptG family permease [bacterium]|nr:LptF/LptG family permease [bacterium]